MSTIVQSLLVKTYVNCVKFLSEKYLLASAGNVLQIYNVTSSELLSSKIIFECQRIHAILVDNKRVLLYGGFNLALVDISVLNEAVTIKILSQWTTDNWVQDASFFHDDRFAVLGSTNALYLYMKDNVSVCLEKEAHCKEKSVLYSGKILGTDWSSAVVLCGTVFSQITIWSPTLDECNIVYRLIGHQGVIFSVTYHEANKTICSTSDDRSLRIWNVEKETSDNNVQDWQHAKITLESSIFGHTARVWKSLQLSDGKIITIGEDGQLKVWRKDTFVHCWNAHQNGNIWSVDYNETLRLIVTGGGDGGICLWPLSDENLSEPEQVDVSLMPNDFPRQVVMARNKKLLLYTNNGTILTYKAPVSDLALDDVRFRSYCILTISKTKEYYCTASMLGDILIFSEETDEILCEHTVGKVKIFSFHWLVDNHFVICTPQGKLTVLQFVPGQKCIVEVHQFTLPPCKERWLTSALLLEKLFVCGDRDGSIHIYNLETQCLLKTYFKIHSRLGVSCIEYVNKKTLLSIGRDGYLRHWEITKEEKSDDNDVKSNVRLPRHADNSHNITITALENSSTHCDVNLYHVSADKLPIEWPVHIVSSGADNFIIGFNEVHLVIWSTQEQKIILKLQCGGGHRSWDYCMLDSRFYFSYIKQKTVYHVDVDLSKLTRPAIVQSFHRDEVNALACIQMEQEDLLVSGGEDNTLRISALSLGNKTKLSLRTCLILRSHISSIRCLNFLHIRECVYIASGGGRAQLKIWKLSRSVIDNQELSSPRQPSDLIETDSVERGGSEGKVQYQCKELYSHMLNGEDKNDKSWKLVTPRVNPETRYMDLALYYHCELLYITAACSDGYVRVFLYHLEENSFTCIQELSHHVNCVLKVHIVEYRNQILLCSMSTNGDLAIWDCRNLMERPESNLPLTLDPSSGKFTKDNEDISNLNINTTKRVNPVPEDQVSESSTQENSTEDFNTSNLLNKISTNNPPKPLKASNNPPPSPLATFSLHQGGINSFDSRPVGSHLLLISGGYDCSLVLLELDAHLKLRRQIRQHQAHSSQITGVKFLDNQRIVTSSVDQQIIVWAWPEMRLEGLSENCDKRRDSSHKETQLIKETNSNMESKGLTQEVNGMRRESHLKGQKINLNEDKKDLNQQNKDSNKQNSDSRLQLFRLSQQESCIPDIHGLSVMDGGRVCLYGCGVEIVQVMEVVKMS